MARDLYRESINLGCFFGSFFLVVFLVFFLGGCAGSGHHIDKQVKTYYHMAPSSRAFVEWQQTSPF